MELDLQHFWKFFNGQKFSEKQPYDENQIEAVIRYQDNCSQNLYLDINSWKTKTSYEIDCIKLTCSFFFLSFFLFYGSSFQSGFISVLKKCTTRNQSESTFIIITEQKRAGGLSNNRKSIDCLLMTRGRCPNFRIAIKKLRAWENIWTQSQITFYMQSPINLQKNVFFGANLVDNPGNRPTLVLSDTNGACYVTVNSLSL